MEETKIALVEDELIIARSLKNKLESQGYKVIGPAIDYEEAVKLIESNSVDLVLIDIRLNGAKTGVDFAHYLKQNHQDLPFIFLTSYTDFQTLQEVKTTNPSGYLTKPIEQNSLYCTIEVVLHNHRSAQMPPSYIILPLGNKKEKVNVNEILYLEAEHVYVHVVMESKKYLVRSSLTHMLEQLPRDIFYKSHRSFVVNKSHIKSFTTSSLILNSYDVPMSRSYRDKLIALF